MKVFIKNRYLFLIFFIILISKNTFLNLIKYTDNINNTVITLYQNPYKLNEEIYLNVGNLNINSYIIKGDILIGTIKYSYQNYSVIKLLSSKDTYMQVKVNDCYLIMQNDGTNLYLNNSNCIINNEDIIYTTDIGINDVYKIGKVEIKDNKYMVNLLYDYSDLNDLEIRNIIWDY